MSEEQKANAQPLPSLFPPPPPPAPPAEKLTVIAAPPVPPAPTELNVPGPPPAPPAPLEHVKQMAAQGARFYITGQGLISAKEAIKLVEEEKNLSIKVTDYGSVTTVFLTKENK